MYILKYKESDDIVASTDCYNITTPHTYFGPESDKYIYNNPICGILCMPFILSCVLMIKNQN
jgi:hypothetical protein